MFKKLIVYFQSVFLIWGSVVHAEPQNHLSKDKKIRQAILEGVVKNKTWGIKTVKRPKEWFDKEIAKRIDQIEIELPKNSKVLSASTEVMRAYILVYVLTIIEIVKAEFEKAGISDPVVSSKAVGEKIAVVTEEILDSGAITSGLISTYTAHKFFSVPLKAFHHLVESQVYRPMIKSLLTSLVGTYLTFFSWDFGDQFWQEAKLMIKDYQVPQESKDFFQSNLQSNALWSNVYNVIVSKGKPETAEERTSMLILGLIFENMFKYMLMDPDLRFQLVYNTLRHKIFKGEFATMVTTMVATQVIGPKVVNWGPMRLAAAGGAIYSLFVPDEVKNRITYGLRESWRSVLDRGELNASSAVLESYKSGDNIGPYNLKEVLESRGRLREKIADIFIERIYLARYKLEELYSHSSENSENSENSEIILFDKRIKDAEQDLVNLYFDEELFFRDLIAKKGSNSTLETELNKAQSLKIHMCTVVDGLNLVEHIPGQDKFIAKVCGISDIKEIRREPDLNPEELNLYKSGTIQIAQLYLGRMDEIEVALARLSQSAFINLRPSNSSEIKGF